MSAKLAGGLSCVAFEDVERIVSVWVQFMVSETILEEN